MQLPKPTVLMKSTKRSQVRSFLLQKEDPRLYGTNLRHGEDVLSQIGQFPQEGGLWWLGPEPCPELFALREELIFQLERRGLWYQPGEFRPHVTLARKVSFPGEAPGVEALLPQPLAAPCGRVSLVRSQLTAAGALYNEVAGKNPPV